MNSGLGDMIYLPPSGSGPRPLPYARQPILPDSVLPPALQRTNPLLRFVEYTPNKWDAKMLREAAAWRWIALNGGLKDCCRIPELRAPVYDTPPWQSMPSNGIQFNQMFSQQTINIPQDGSDFLLGSFQVPSGYDGAINRFVCNFSGNGFVDFSGSIAWRLMVGTRFARNFGNVLNTFGSFQTAFLVPGTDIIRLVSGQSVLLFCSIPNGSPIAGGQVSAGAFGWFYPRR
jgi:hypothetical protein